jgi:hypothetical protein
MRNVMICSRTLMSIGTTNIGVVPKMVLLVQVITTNQIIMPITYFGKHQTSSQELIAAILVTELDPESRVDNIVFNQELMENVV